MENEAVKPVTVLIVGMPRISTADILAHSGIGTLGNVVTERFERLEDLPEPYRQEVFALQEDTHGCNRFCNYADDAKLLSKVIEAQQSPLLERKIKNFGRGGYNAARNRIIT